MSEMVERIARELCRQENVRPDLWSHYSSQARGVLKAMREPTSEMVGEGEDAWSASTGYQYSGVKEAWQAMIDEALSNA